MLTNHFLVNGQGLSPLQQEKLEEGGAFNLFCLLRSAEDRMLLSFDSECCGYPFD